MEKNYTNGEVTIVWKPDLCIHSANCIRGLPEVFNNKARPWITPEGAGTAAIIDQVGKCPSGALSYRMNNEVQATAPKQEVAVEKTKLTALLNGPLMVEGTFECLNAAGEVLTSKNKIFLCRCGQSANKPFCDGAHKKAGFIAG